MSESNTLKKLNIGCGKSPMKGFVNLDRQKLDGVDVVFDLETCGQKTHFPSTFDTVRIPLADNTFDRMICSHVAEHITNFLPMMEELWRIAKPGCSAVFLTPYGGHDIAFEDPTHVRQFFAKSWLYVAQTAYGGADYGYRGDWDCKQLIFKLDRKRVPDNIAEQDGSEIMRMVSSLRNVCMEITAELIAVKPARIAGSGEWAPEIRFQVI